MCEDLVLETFLTQGEKIMLKSQFNKFSKSMMIMRKIEI